MSRGTSFDVAQPAGLSMVPPRTLITFQGPLPAAAARRSHEWLYRLDPQVACVTITA